MKKIFSILLSISFFMGTHTLAFADYGRYCDPNGNPTNITHNRLYTAIGCVPIGDTQSFLVFIFRWAVGVGGGIAFLLIILSSFQIMSSSGNPEKIQAGKELLTSAIAGLIMLVFSYYILKIIGIDLLKLPGSPSL